MRSISSPRGSRKRTSSGREDVYPGKWLISCHGPVPKEAFISSRLSVITTYSPGSAGRSIPLTDPPPDDAPSARRSSKSLRFRNRPDTFLISTYFGDPAGGDRKSVV